MQRSESANPRGCRFTGSVAVSVAIDRRPSVQQFSRKGELECESERCCWQRLSLPRWSVAPQWIHAILLPNPARTQNCNTRDCPPLVVTVKENPAQHTCEAAVDDLNVSSGPEGERSVEWKIATPGYEFSKEPYKFAIFVKSNPDGKFKGANTSTSGQVLSLKFVHNTHVDIEALRVCAGNPEIGRDLLRNARSLADQLASPSDSQARTSAIASSNGSARPAASAIAKPESRSASRVFASSGWRNASSAGSRRMPVRSV